MFGRSFDRSPSPQPAIFMSALDDHNRQHTYGNSLGLPTSVVGVSAQQTIDNHNRLVEASMRRGAATGEALGARAFFKGALIAGAIAGSAVVAAFVVGGIGAVAFGLIAFVAGAVAVVFLISALIQAVKRQFD